MILDKTEIGDPNPDFTYGLQLFMEYKNFDFQIVGVGKSWSTNSYVIFQRR